MGFNVRREFMLTTTKMNNQGIKETRKDLDEDMLDEDEDIAMAKVIQASLDDAKAEKTKADLKALQKAMGVGVPKSASFAAPDTDMAIEDDGFIEPDELDEPDGDEQGDITMAEAEELEREITYSNLGGGGNDEGDSV